MLVVPEQHSHDMERRLCAIGGNRVSRYAEVLSFTRMAGRVFAVTGGLAAPTLDAGGRLLLMYAALQGVAGELKVYGRPSRKPEFLSGLIATVDEELLRHAQAPVDGGGGGRRPRGGQAAGPVPHLRRL